ncbi:hypothetical protein POM88_001636 [Heracleum sosnowskyi]|uniref:Uncharacterized protein n=1 Tax=Heracleum sosnowskyi TaxID=360622 RepID=A0AAD8NB09_9APIA|nr:hypothetical protein POM88_001636 [Heracleum sosnowskyi]
MRLEVVKLLEMQYCIHPPPPSAIHEDQQLPTPSTFPNRQTLILIIPKLYSFKSDLVCSTFSIHPSVLNRRTMDHGNVSGSTPCASSSSVGMTSMKCDVNLSKSDQDCAIIIQEDDLSTQKNEPPTKKQKALTSGVWAHFDCVERQTKEGQSEKVVEDNDSSFSEWDFYAYFLHSFSAFFRFFMQSAAIFLVCNFLLSFLLIFCSVFSQFSAHYFSEDSSLSVKIKIKSFFIFLPGQPRRRSLNIAFS